MKSCSIPKASRLPPSQFKRASRRRPAGNAQHALPVESCEGSLTPLAESAWRRSSIRRSLPAVIIGKYRSIQSCPPLGREPKQKVSRLTTSNWSVTGRAAWRSLRKSRLTTSSWLLRPATLFGNRHYKSYRFLVTLSDKMPFHGLEHHESSDNGMPGAHVGGGGQGHRLLAATRIRPLLERQIPSPQRPGHAHLPEQRRALLWVYEGLTEYLGTVLAARSGLWTLDDARQYLAVTAKEMQNQNGRTWRPLEDTTLVAPCADHDAAGWRSWRRAADYYDEGTLIWLEIDTKIRQLTKGEHWLDDFCRRYLCRDGRRCSRSNPMNWKTSWRTSTPWWSMTGRPC